jgi:hypothetical protein
VRIGSRIRVFEERSLSFSRGNARWLNEKLSTSPRNTRPLGTALSQSSKTDIKETNHLAIDCWIADGSVLGLGRDERPETGSQPFIPIIIRAQSAPRL